jgi:hypothetical protein
MTLFEDGDRLAPEAEELRTAECEGDMTLQPGCGFGYILLPGRVHYKMLRIIESILKTVKSDCCHLKIYLGVQTTHRHLCDKSV